MRRPGWLALLASFSVYLIPLFPTHGGWVFVASLALDFARAGGRPTLWSATNLVVALLLQAAAGLLIYWLLRRPGWRRVAAATLAAPLFPVAANGFYLYLIPLAFLVERDTAPEQGDRPAVCAVSDAALSPVRSPFTQAVVRRTQGISFGLLEMPGCTVRELQPGVHYDNAYVAASGTVLHHSTERGLVWYWTAGPGAKPARLEEPPDVSNVDGMPILSRDGRWVAWNLGKQHSGSTPRAPVVLLRQRGAAQEMRLSLQALVPGTFTLLDLDMASRKLVVLRGNTELFDVDLEGTSRPRPAELGGIEPHPSTWRIIGDGWVAWDGYREQDAYRIVWSLPGGRGVHRVPKGRSIQSLAASSDGRYIAVSVTGSLSIGSVRDSVYVLRASDGAEVFRRYLPRYARSEVAFPEGGYFAYTHSDGVRGEVRVLTWR